MFKYRLQTPLGEDIGEATYGFLLEPGEELTIGKNNQRLRIIKVVPVQEPESDLDAVVYVETA